MYTRACSVVGAAARQLSAVLSTAGYAGALSLNELTIRNPVGSANDLYIGQSDVDATNGLKLTPGESITWRATNQGDVIDASRVYLYVAVTQNAAVSLRAK